MNMTNLMQYVSLALIVLGALAFITSVIVQTIKDMPVLAGIPTNVVTLVVSLILCPLVVIIACQHYGIPIIWYYLVAAFIAAFIVYLVATGGWERVREMWERTRYKDDGEATDDVSGRDSP